MRMRKWLYNPVGGVCTQSCNYNIAGATTPTGSLDSGSGIITCSSSDNFSGTDFSYVCAGNVAITGSCACADGYEYDSDTSTHASSLLAD